MLLAVSGVCANELYPFETKVLLAVSGVCANELKLSETNVLLAVSGVCANELKLSETNVLLAASGVCANELKPSETKVPLAISGVCSNELKSFESMLEFIVSCSLSTIEAQSLNDKHVDSLIQALSSWLNCDNNSLETNFRSNLSALFINGCSNNLSIDHLLFWSIITHFDTKSINSEECIDGNL